MKFHQLDLNLLVNVGQRAIHSIVSRHATSTNGRNLVTIIEGIEAGCTGIADWKVHFTFGLISGPARSRGIFTTKFPMHSVEEQNGVVVGIVCIRQCEGRVTSHVFYHNSVRVNFHQDLNNLNHVVGRFGSVTAAKHAGALALRILACPMERETTG